MKVFFLFVFLFLFSVSLNKYRRLYNSIKLCQSVFIF